MEKGSKRRNLQNDCQRRQTSGHLSAAADFHVNDLFCEPIACPHDLRVVLSIRSPRARVEHLVRGHLQNGLSGEVEVHALPGWPASRIQHLRVTRLWRRQSLPAYGIAKGDPGRPGL
jgi:hypothetical protein